MPQMAPMFWTLLMMLFILIFLMFTVKLYFYSSSQQLWVNKTELIKLSNQWTW
uniref:ATP synthase complex subunit 8 n=1 Tax=Proasellus granadensis TaxID=1281974 RepID=A0A485M8U6_9CRUS|nr:ATP synthase 8 [Proasellus granadensis]